MRLPSYSALSHLLFSYVAWICLPVPEHSAWQTFCFDFGMGFLPQGFYQYTLLPLFLPLSIEVPARLKAMCKGRGKSHVHFLPKGQSYHKVGRYELVLRCRHLCHYASDRAKFCWNNPSCTSLLILVLKMLCNVTESTKCQVKT